MLRGAKQASVVAIVMGIFLSVVSYAQDFAGARYQEEKRKSNDNTVSIIVSALTCTCARFAEDIRNVVNDMRPGGIRVFPILSVGGVQNIKDILFLRGIDFGIVQQDNLYALKKSDPTLYANLENRVQYITKLYNAEVHIIARAEIHSLADLQGKAVNFHLADSPAATTAENIFSTLKINVKKTYLDHPAAFEKLSTGELSAVIVMTGAPQPSVNALKADTGFHFLPIDEESLPGYNVRPLLAEYLPAELTHELYPNLVEEGKPVPTIANRALLAVYNWPENTERYARAARFVNEFFSQIDKFHDRSHHPKWAEVNLAAEIPGWVRFKPAKEWLNGRRAITAQTGSISGGDAEQAFESFLLNYAASTGKGINPKDRDALLAEFKQFLDKRAKSTAR
jgi:uncharacterized protein